MRRHAQHLLPMEIQVLILACMARGGIPIDCEIIFLPIEPHYRRTDQANQRIFSIQGLRAGTEIFDLNLRSLSGQHSGSLTQYLC